MAGISNAYAMWIGSESYPKFADWEAEALRLGVSKRLPNAAVGKKLKEPNTAVFVLHDEGDFSECTACLAAVECGECRKAEQEMDRIQKEIDAFIKPFDSREGLLEHGKAGVQRSLRIREEKLAQLEEKIHSCDLCEGLGTYEGGTGGSVKTADGKEMDYRAYNYWLHQPKKATIEVASSEMCEECGGTGKIPDARCFGLFIPQAVEYILAGDETPEELAKVESLIKISKPVLLTEERRKCGVRKTRGVYAVTGPESDVEAAERSKLVLDDLIERGVVKSDGAEVHGAFIKFIESIAVKSKRFRGIAEFPLAAALEDAAKDIMDALEA